MNKSRQSFTIEEYKIQASILLKSLRGSDPENAAKRFKRLPEFAALSIADILQKNIKRKHALLLIAVENGFHSWLDLKMQVNFIVGGYLNSWFSNYPEAKSYLLSTGGFLLPYKNQFFICNKHYIKQIGFEPDDPDWKLIGYDWVAPDDKKGWQRLYKKWSLSLGGRHE
jgi:hypothetical protein